METILIQRAIAHIAKPLNVPKSTTRETLSQDKIVESLRNMANTKFQYVRNFEQKTSLLPNCFTVIRIDGRGFTRFVKDHGFEKPNDIRGIRLMNAAARKVFEFVPDCILAYGQSDEYSFVLPKTSNLFSRRTDKLLSLTVSSFSSAYVLLWPEYFKSPLQTLPTFDGRLISFPTFKNLRDYLSWRQADCHINNLYNTCFWNLVMNGNQTPEQAEETLRGTVSGDKNELLFSQFDINYNNIESVYRKGTILFYSSSKSPRELIECSEDVIGDSFWTSNPHLSGDS